MRKGCAGVAQPFFDPYFYCIQLELIKRHYFWREIASVGAGFGDFWGGGGLDKVLGWGLELILSGITEQEATAKAKNVQSSFEL